MTNHWTRLKEATPKELLEAIIWFYSQNTDKPDFVVSLLRLGFAVARPGGWENVAPAWLEKMRESEADCLSTVSKTGVFRKSNHKNVIHVDSNNTTTYHDGLSWKYAYTRLQDALAVAGDGDEIWVAEGVYYPDIDSEEK